MKPEYRLDGRRIFSLETFYDELQRALIIPPAWGRSLGALADLLAGGDFGLPESGFRLRWEHSAISRKRLGHSETVRQLELRLVRCHSESRASVQSDIALAQQGRGPTVFDWLVETIRDHGRGVPGAEHGVILRLA